MNHGIEKLGREISSAKAQKMCFAKRPFDTKNEARDFAKRGTKNYGNQIQKPYQCMLCGKFHLTTVRKSKKRLQVYEE